jgi:hypothetical protein
MSREDFHVRGIDGSIRVVTCIRGEIPTTTLTDKRHTSIRGLAEFFLDDGSVLNRIDDNTFQRVSTGERFTRIHDYR